MPVATTDPEEAMIQHLIYSTAIAAVVGGRVFPKRIPHGESLPAITVNRIDTIYEKVHGEPSLSKTPKLQIVSWATSLDTAKSLGAKVETALDGFMGVLGHGTSVMEVEVINIEGENFDDDKETGLNWINQDYSILITP